MHFRESYNLKLLIREPPCFKKFDMPTCTDLMLINQLRSLQSSCAVDTGLSDSYRITVTRLKMYFGNQ